MPVVSRETQDRLLKILRHNGLVLTNEQIFQIDRYAEVLLGWNKQINLISRSLTGQEVRFTHFIHSVAPLFFLSIRGPLSVLDIGSGGGLPGIPIAILRPEFRILLVDSIAKKVRAMESMVNELALPNVSVVNSRVEDLVRNGLLKEKIDLALARAVAPLADLVRWCRPFMREGGAVAEWKQAGKGTPVRLPALLAWKGGDLAQELATLKNRTGCSGTVFPLVFPGSDETGLEEKNITVVELGTSGDRT